MSESCTVFDQKPAQSKMKNDLSLMFFLHVSTSTRLSSGTIILRHTSRFCQRCEASLTESAVFVCLVQYNLPIGDPVEDGTCTNISDKCLFYI